MMVRSDASAVLAKEPFPVKKGCDRRHPPSATVAELKSLPWVQLNRDPHFAIGSPHEPDLLCHAVFRIIKDPRQAAVVGKLPMGRGAGQVLPVFVHDQDFDRFGIVHPREDSGIQAGRQISGVAVGMSAALSQRPDSPAEIQPRRHRITS